MRIINLRLALETTILLIVCSIAAHADNLDTAVYARGGVRAKLEYCKDCHGLSGQGYRGYFTMPRLAGQSPQYLENQLRAFVERRRTGNIFLDLARVHGVNPAMRSALAAHFKELNPSPAGGGPRNLIPTGQAIYENGVPESNIPACSACHGPDAKGQNEIPRLAGQMFGYTVKQLSDWNKERGQGVSREDPSAVMTPISHNLNPSQIAAIAAYLSYLK